MCCYRSYGVIAAIVATRITQPIEGVGLRVIYLVERVCCQLAGKDEP